MVQSGKRNLPTNKAWSLLGASCGHRDERHTPDVWMHEEMKKNTIWWRLTPIAFWLTAVSLFVLLAWRASEWKPPLLVLVLLWIGLSLPNLYLTGFSLWHWKFRYRGVHPVAWAVAFPIFWSYAPALFYFDRHINPDRKGKKQYDVGDAPAPSAVPGKYNTIRSASFVLGGAMLAWAALASVIATIAYWAIFSVWDDALTRNIGKVLTTGEVNAFHVAHRCNQIMVGILCSAAITGAVGGVLLSVSHSIRWRLREQEERRASNQASYQGGTLTGGGTDE